MTHTPPIPAGFDAGRFRLMTTVSGACFAGFNGLVVCAVFQWFGRPQWWWLVLLLGFGAGLWYCHREASAMRSDLAVAWLRPSEDDALPSGSPAERPVLTRYCSSCQAPIRRGIVHCTSCGEHLGEAGGYFE